ncbi:hypothetical protein [Yersinia enterocolitica]|uniref:hypothetical protein n=1 Tax=Yersinia enterocolitica TaxID=630 RepID=UPI003F4769E1
MNEKPILFNSEMVNAILSGRKTQTRRIMKVQPSEHFHPQTIHGAMDFTAHWYTPGVIDKDGYLQPARKDVFGVADEDEGYACPLGAVGDQLWVREAFATGLCTKSTLAYRATHKTEDLEEGWGETIKWTPSIHMPRWASRINLLITGVRVERLQSITLGDICKEVGCGLYDFFPATDGFRVWTELWDSIYGQKEGENWQANPWVWVINFERMEAK